MEVSRFMEPSGRFLDKIKLDNGLTAYFYDQSKPVAGDRRQVQLLVYVPLEIKQSYFTGCPDPGKSYEAFTATFGPTITFEQVRTRNFIAQDEVGSLLDTMKEELRSNMTYLAKPAFAEKYVRKRYDEWDKEQTLRRKYSEALHQAEE